MNVEGTALVPVYKKNKLTEYRAEKVYYMSLLEKRNDTIHVKTITDGFTTRKVFKNPDELKNLVAESIGLQKNIYDELYVLSYRKIKKPQPLAPR